MYTVRTIACKLAPTEEQRTELNATLVAFADACNCTADVARAIHSTNKVLVQHACYQDIRQQCGLSANLAIRAIARVCAALKVPAKMHSVFAPTSADYDARIFSLREWDWTFSMTLLHHRAHLATKLGDYQKRQLQGRLPRSATLVKRRDGTFFVHVVLTDTVSEPEEPHGMIGMDLGIKNLATTDDGEHFSGDAVEAVRKRYGRMRRTCQQAGTKSAKRKLQKIRMRESRMRAHENHRMSNRLIAKAKDTRSAIACEDLTGIGDRITARKAQRSRLKGWAFYQLRTFIIYKAKREGILVLPVDQRNTSRTFSSCGHCEKRNRKSRDEFVCRHCGYALPADWNAAKNIQARGEVMHPVVEVVDAGTQNLVETTNKPRQFIGSGS